MAQLNGTCPHVYNFKFVEILEKARKSQTEVDLFSGIKVEVPTYTASFFTVKQRDGNRLHEVPYFACFKPALPRFFIERFSAPGDVVYDPFMGRGTTLIEAALLGRVPYGNDSNPLSASLVRPRLNPPLISDVTARLDSINFENRLDYDALPTNYFVYFHPRTLKKLCTLRKYLLSRQRSGQLDNVDAWIWMVTMTRLTGHSGGYCSRYTLPPNLLASEAGQHEINKGRYLISPEEIIDPLALADKLSKPEAGNLISRFLSRFISHITTQKLMACHNSGSSRYHGELQKYLAADLNTAIQTGALYDSEVFKGRNLSRKVERLLRRHPEKRDTKTVMHYRYDEGEPKSAPHRRPVDWLSLEPWHLPQNEGPQTTVFRLKKYEENLLETEKRILDGNVLVVPTQASSSPSVAKLIQLDGIPGRIQTILERKCQVILYGPPGTGKTYWARRAARDLASIAAFGKLFEKLSDREKLEIDGDGQVPGLVRFCTFHPAYGYEDFIEGYRPQQSKADQLVFVRREGIFKTICNEARNSKHRKFYLLIDEINRGDIPRIFGELLTLLEKDKRSMELTLPVSGERFSVPPNVFVIGTMNTADRSIALLDTALRRRFGFIELMPNPSVLTGVSAGGRMSLAAWLTALNERIRAHCGRDARNLQIGHAYFLEDGRPISSISKFARVLAEDVIPLLEEYCYEDYGALKNILGEAIIDEPQQRVREELFNPAQQEKLIQALAAISPEMSTSLEAAQPAAELAEAHEQEPGEE